MDRFRDGTRQNARRILEDKWEEHKDLILELYKTKSIKEVKKHMEQEKGFIASHRQFGYRIREVWEVKRYKKDKQKGPDGGPRRSQEQPAQGTQRRSAVASPEEHHPRCGDLPHRHPLSSPAAIREIQASNVAGPAALSPAPPATPGPIQRPLSYLAQLGSPDSDSRLRHRWLADMLLALGDAHHAFDIGAALWKAGQTNGAQPSQEALVHIVSCVRTARTHAQAATCREMLNAIDIGVSRDEGSWRTTVKDFLCAQAYRCDTDARDGLEQIENIISDIVEVDQGSWRLKTLTRREELRFDVPAYILLSSALEWYNHCAVPENQDQEVHVKAVLKQFIDQQPVFLEEPDINFCLPLCLSWCIDVLKGDPTIPPIAPDVVGTSIHCNYELYTVLCALWKIWLDSPLPPSSCSPAWADDAESQLGITATQLLCTVVCMMMAAAPQQENIEDASIPLSQKALAGASALDSLDRKELIRRFLAQVRATNQPLMGPPHEEHLHLQNSAVEVSALNPFRVFIARSLRIEDLPALEEGAVVYPLVLAAT
ncbi:hypothetical protein C8A03DRAFT_12792 [Achaetomium macrosporum]|uniref:Clr5 domain-containing protein n=1 Tax=Achaetomium macrosporum TaxID=79813 RepID=A0AAN7CF86_9PEZI|nr:hypothetical protein C8A03DRAFT_12792 [Achaetomium macrosporum]